MAPVPDALTDAPFVPVSRYHSREFFDLERERLWPRVWQVACRLEEIPSVGDFTEYSICDQSLILVRSEPDRVRAFGNACRHRATQLVTGAGSFRGERIVCPFHGWQWDLDGNNTFVYGEQGFESRCLDGCDLQLREYRVGHWGGCVFVNLDGQAPSLEEALSSIAALLDPLAIDRMRVRWWKSVLLNANWKLAQEAFMEGFHVMQTHPQLSLGLPDDPDAQVYQVHPNGHSHFQNRVGRSQVPEGIDPLEVAIESSRLLHEGLQAMTLERDLRAIEGLRNGEEPGRSVGRKIVEAIYEAAATEGVTLPSPDPEAIARWGGVFFVFPNYFILPQYGNALIYRSRPNGTDPESCLFELWSVSIPPEGDEPMRPSRLGPFGPDDATVWPTIPLQDFSNIERQQRGIHTLGFDRMRLSDRYEGGILNMHRELDRYLFS
jgi:phenylpropionate dioxygenase-like ring-hydroxylating dioxygenase large terminal subunit